MKDAKSSYKKAGPRNLPTSRRPEAPTDEKKKLIEEDDKPKKKGRKVAKQHTKGLGNVEEGRNAEKPMKKKRQRKRPVLGGQYKMQN